MFVSRTCYDLKVLFTKRDEIHNPLNAITFCDVCRARLERTDLHLHLPSCRL